MCCERCEKYARCASGLHFRVHTHTHSSVLPNPHYHACRGASEHAGFDCLRCGNVVTEFARLPQSHSAYGCCHRCPEYAKCDFVARHQEQMRLEARPPGEFASPTGELRMFALTPAGIPPHAAAGATPAARVLVVEDEAAVRESIVQALARRSGMVVQACADGCDALRRLSTFRPDVCILDVMLAGVNGLEICRRVRRMEQTRAASVLITTGFPSKDLMEDARRQGADLLVIKPMDAVALSALVRDIAAAREQTPEASPTPLVTVPGDDPTKIPGTREHFALHPTRVLIVDDNEPFRAGITEFMKRSPALQVESVEGGRDALRVFRTFKPHVVVLDLFLPDISGFDVCRSIRRADQDHRTRILVLTGYPTDENVEHAAADGADVCLHKPIQPDVLRYEAWRLGQDASATESGSN